jgi:hypothetical protein
MKDTRGFGQLLGGYEDDLELRVRGEVFASVFDIGWDFGADSYRGT